MNDDTIVQSVRVNVMKPNETDSKNQTEIQNSSGIRLILNNKKLVWSGTRGWEN